MNNLKARVIDDGFAYTKSAWRDEGQDEIKTCATPTYLIEGVKRVVSSTDESSVMTYETDEGAYTVGYQAEQSDIRFDGFAFSPYNRVMVNHILRKTGVEPGDKVSLVASIPMSMFYSGEHDQIIEKRKANLQKPVRALGEEDYIHIENVEILPEAASAYIDVVMKENGNDSNLFSHGTPPSLVIVDIGGRATDIASMMKGNNILMQNSGTADIGVLTLIDAVRASVEQIIRQNSTSPSLTINVPIRQAESILRNWIDNKNGTATIQGKTHDMSSAIEMATKSFIQRVMKEVTLKIQSITSQVDGIVVVGGGAALLKEHLGQVHPNIYVPDAPQFANVRGMFKYQQYLTE